MEFPKTFDEFARTYSIKDTEEIYSNGVEFIPVFRVEQWLEHISEKTQMIDKSNFDEEQYKTDLQSAYDCGYNKALSENKCFDGMTNGDIIKTLFPKIDDNFSNVIDLKLWWNAPYQKGGE